MEDPMKFQENLEVKDTMDNLNENQRILELSAELGEEKEKLRQAHEALATLERLYTTTHGYSVELRRQVVLLTAQLQTQQISPSVRQFDMVDATTQYDEEDTKQLAQTTGGTLSLPASSIEIDSDTKNISESVDWTVGNEGCQSIVDCLRETAEAVGSQSGFVFDPQTHLYYDCQSGYYYDAEKSLYYEPQYGAYYSYCLDTQTYVFHSYIDRTKYQTLHHIIYSRTPEPSTGKKSRKKSNKRCEKEVGSEEQMKNEQDSTNKITHNSEVRNEETCTKGLDKPCQYLKIDSHENCVSQHSSHSSIFPDESVCIIEPENEASDSLSESDLEDGELSDTEEEQMETHESQVPISELTQGPPCIRAIVKSSDCLPVGKLYIVTCTGATVGRQADLNHAILVPASDISKMHCDIQYSPALQRYVVKDFASQSGTFVNGQRISKAKVISEPKTVFHRDLLRLGSNNEFELHIHPRTNTCDGCEPGLLQAAASLTEVVNSVHQTESEPKLGKEASRRRQLKRIKKKKVPTATLR